MVNNAGHHPFSLTLSQLLRYYAPLPVMCHHHTPLSVIPRPAAAAAAATAQPAHASSHTAAGEENTITVGAAAANHLNPLGRASMQRPDAATLARASLVRVSVNNAGLRRVSGALPAERASMEMAMSEALRNASSLHAAGGANNFRRVSTMRTRTSLDLPPTTKASM